MRVSVELLPDAGAAEVLAALDVADGSTIDSAFCVDEVYHRDAWCLLAAGAQRTRRVRLGPGVAGVTLRDPLLVAQQLATLDELSQGRAIAAVSVGNLAMLKQFGVDPAELRIAKRMREARAAMRAPLTFRLAGEVADGVYAACSLSREALGYVAENVRLGAERAGREYGDLEICASVTAAVADDGAAARRAARLKAAFYLPSMPPALVERHGIPFAEVEPINAAFARGDVEQALSLTSDEIGDRLSIAGTPEEVAERLRSDIFAAGFNHAVLAIADREIPRTWAGVEIPGLPTVSEQVRLIADRVLPSVAS